MENEVVNKYICIVCFISTISQIPYIYSSAILSKMVSLSWMALAGMLLISNGLKIPRCSVLAFPIIFDLFCIIGQIILGYNYVGANLFRPVNLCTFVFIVGLLASNVFDFESLVLFAKTYVWGTTITSIIIYFQYCFGKTVSENDYLYNGKNSLASIILVSMIFVVLLRKYFCTTKIKKIIMILLIIYDIYLLFILKSRTTLVCFAALLIWFVVSKNTKWSVKLFIIVSICLFLWYIFNNEKMYDTIVNTILLNGKEATNLNDITSDRMDHFTIFQSLFPGNELIGIGGYYLESFPLTALLSFGWIGSIWIFAFAFAPILSGVQGIYYRSKNQLFSFILLAISISLIINGIAEEQPPFGPGIKCFAMWFLYGVYFGKSQYIDLQKRRKY